MHIMNQFFSGLEAKDIRYVHFKSNKNLEMSFAGKGDFDVLTDPDRIHDVEAVLLSLRARRFNRVRYGIYPGVDNWLLFDPETGGLYHLHLHYQLASGKQLLKEYVIPWSSMLFDTRIRDLGTGIYISDPHAELLLLTVRTVIKSRFPDWIRARLHCYRLHSSLRSEREDLLSRIDPRVLTGYAERVFSPEAAVEIAELAHRESWSGPEFRRATRIVRKELKEYRRYNGPVSELKSRMLWLGDGWNKFCRRKLGRCCPEKKTTLSGGKIIAFVGVDGAGKSTMKNTIYKWMNKQIESRCFYMGTGDGKVTLFAGILKRLNRMVSGRDSQKGRSGQKNPEKTISLRKNPKAYLKKIAAAAMVYSVEKNNRRKLIRMNRYRLNGGICLLDRYPQIEMAGQNDGPKVPVSLKRMPDSRYLKRLLKKEEKQLSIVKKIKPDFMIRLNISAETSMRRKPEQQDIDSFRRKIEELHQITFQGTRIIDLDAEQPFEEELLAVKRIIWENL